MNSMTKHIFLSSALLYTTTLYNIPPSPVDRIWNITYDALKNNVESKSRLDTINTEAAFSNLENIEQQLTEIESSLETIASEIPRIIMGYINTLGTIIAGTGFSVSNISVGKATITFDSPFPTPPFVVASIDYTTNGGEAPSVSNVFTTGFELNTFDSNFSSSAPHPASNKAVYFIVIGSN